ncbi:MAG: hypothetical protein NTV05_03805 [Acidobacteria bacterium]|nr:hypothetical protein [Acidobacteriota bacterium]
MSKRTELRALHDALAESVLCSSDEELIEEVREEGLNPDAVAEDMRALLFRTLKTFQQRALVAAREQHREKAARLAAKSFRLPTSPAERRQLLDAVIAQHQQAGRMLTAQHRDFNEMTDEDVESWLQQFGHLGLLDAKPETDE